MLNNESVLELKELVYVCLLRILTQRQLYDSVHARGVLWLFLKCHSTLLERAELMNFSDSWGMLYFIGFVFMFILLFGVAEKKEKHPSKNPRFLSNFFLQLVLYFLEIAAMFYLFQIISIYFVDSLGYKEPSTLKRFIDFFTAYQIFIFVVLKLYDSLKKDSYNSILYVIELAQPFMELNKPVDKNVWKGNDLYKKMDSLSKDTYGYYKDFYSLLLMYEQFRIQSKCDDRRIKELNNALKTHKIKLDEFNISIEEVEDSLENSNSRLDDAKLGINVLKANINISKEETDFHWNVSLFFRLFKHWFK